MSTERREAYDRLVARHKDAVYRQMVRVCGNRDDAEDVLAEALLSAYRASDDLREEESFRAWLAAIGRRVCSRLRRREKRRPVVQLQALEERLEGEAPSPLDEAASARLVHCVKRALEELPPGYRLAYERVDLDEESLQEAARGMNLSLPALKSRLHRARRMMREALDREVCTP
jgi:RNA polymerase sigma-70 factor, ECF subfamily